MISLGRTLSPSKARSGALRRASRLKLLRCELVSALKFLFLVLELIQLPVNTSLSQELLMRPHFAQSSLVHDKNLVSALNGRQAVRDDKGCTAGHHTRQS